MKRAAPRAEVALDFTKTTVPKLISDARGLANNIPTNPNLTAADIAKLPYSPAELLASALALETTHTLRPTAPSKVNTSLETTEATTVIEQYTGVARFLETLGNSRSGGSYVAAEKFLLSFGLVLKKLRTVTQRGFKVQSPAKATATGQVPTNAASDAVTYVRCSIDGGKTYGPPVRAHAGGFVYGGLPSGVECMFQYAVDTPSGKRTKNTVTWGNEASVFKWSGAVGCMIL